MATDPGALSVAELTAHANARGTGIESITDGELFAVEARTAAHGAFLLDRYDAWITLRDGQGNTADAAFWREERDVVVAHLRIAATSPQSCPICGTAWPCPSFTSRSKAFKYAAERPV